MRGDRTPPAAGDVHVLLAGLSTVDLVHRVLDFPGPGEKAQSTSMAVASGGPAANAAVTVAALGGTARLVTVLGAHPLAELARADLAHCGVRVVDAWPDHADPPPLSSVSVRERDGERVVTAHNATAVRLTAAQIRAAGIEAALDDLSAAAALSGASAARAVLLDGHHPELALAVARAARRRSLPVLLDAGSYRPVMAELLPLVDVCACSAAFRLPDRPAADDTECALLDVGVRAVTRTHGARPVTWRTADAAGAVEVPAVAARDTLGAGDVWHGALAAGVARLGGTPEAPELPRLIADANAVAAVRVRYPGPRTWLAHVDAVDG